MSKPPRHRHSEQLYRVLDDAGLGKPRGARDIEGVDQIRLEAAGDRPEQKLKGRRENQGQGRSCIPVWSINLCNPTTQKVAIILKDVLLPQYFKRRYVWVPTIYPPADLTQLGRRTSLKPRYCPAIPPTRRRTFMPFAAPTQIRSSGLLSSHRNPDSRVRAITPNSERPEHPAPEGRM